MEPNYEQIPPAVLRALVRYKDWRINTGSFCRAVISNDLITAVQRADSGSLKALPHIAAWAYTELPNEAWGSYEKFQQWVSKPITPPDDEETGTEP
jgi:hypothetical protein